MDKPYAKSDAEERRTPGTHLWGEYLQSTKGVAQFYVASVDAFIAAYDKAVNKTFFELVSPKDPMRIFISMTKDGDVARVVEQVYMALGMTPAYVVLESSVEKRIVFDVGLKTIKAVEKFAEVVQRHDVQMDMNVYRKKQLLVAYSHVWGSTDTLVPTEERDVLKRTLICAPTTVVEWTPRPTMKRAKVETTGEASKEDVEKVQRWLDWFTLKLREPKVVNGNFTGTVDNVACPKAKTSHTCTLVVDHETKLGHWSCTQCEEGVVWGYAKVM